MKAVIIDDTIYRVDADTKVTKASGGSTSLTNFKPGTNLEFYALDGLLTKVMPALNSEVSGSPEVPVVTVPVTGSNSAPLHQEDGVWKN